MSAPPTQVIHGDHSIVAGRDVHIGRLEVRVSAEDEENDRRELPKLLRMVRRRWVDGVLADLTPTAVPVQFDASPVVDLVARGWAERDDLPKAAAEDLLAGESIDAIFEAANRFLLILGAEGSGKTTALLQLARSLVERAEEELAKEGADLPRIPVVFSLVTWTAWANRASLASWLVSELGKFHVPAGLAQRWVDRRRLTILLDGLDEVEEGSRAECVLAINSFLETGPEGMVVCSRLEEYRALPERLKLDAAVCLAPLSTERVEACLRAQGSRLDGLRGMLEADPVTRQLASSPLLLNAMMLAYEGNPDAPALLHPEGTQTRRAEIFERYVSRTFEARGRGMTPDEQRQTTRYLGWLARQMIGREDILQVETIQPSWLEGIADRWAYALLSRALVGILLGTFAGGYFYLFVVSGGFFSLGEWVVLRGMCLSAIFCLVVGAVDACRFQANESGRGAAGTESWWITAATVAIYWVVYAALLDRLGFGTFFIASGWCIATLFALRGRSQGLRTDVASVSGLRWSWRHAMRGGLVGFLLGVGILAINATVLHWRVQLSSTVFPAILVGLGGAFGGVVRTVDASQADARGLGLVLRVAARGGRIIGVIVLVIAAVWEIVWTAYGTSKMGLPYLARQAPVLIIVALVTLWGAILGALWYGGMDAMQHVVLRWLLWMRGRVPWRTVQFLDSCTRLRLLQRASGGYRFMHGAFMDYLATQSDVGPPRKATEGTKRSSPLAAMAARGVVLLGSVALLIHPRPEANGTRLEPTDVAAREAIEKCYAGNEERCAALAQFWERSCDLLNPFSCRLLAKHYEIGKVIPRGGLDRARAAREFYAKACALDDGPGCTSLGILYQRGIGGEPDPKQAAAFYKKGCDGGDARGCVQLGFMYEMKNGVESDDKYEAALYAKACDGGFEVGCFDLAEMTADGRGVKKDEARAVALFEHACSANLGVGCSALGLRHETGLEVPVDRTRAIELYGQLCKAGDDWGCQRRARLEGTR